MYCKKKSGMGIGKLIGIMLAVLGAVATGAVLFHFLKKHFSCRCDGAGKCGCRKNESDFSDFALDSDPNGFDIGCGCHVVEDNNDMASEENAVVNSENRMLNIENSK